MKTQHSRKQICMQLGHDDLDVALRNLRWQDFSRPPAWLAGNAPSVAFLKCIGSGPWRIGRRTAVQKQLLIDLERASPRLEITETVSSDYSFPLDWQIDYFNKAKAACTEAARTFNGMFNVPVMSPETLNRNFVDVFGPLEAVSKVQLMFARDYLLIRDAFPIDRHVRRWMEGVGLKGKTYWKVVSVLHERGVPPAAVSRAIFGAHSENPLHTL